MRAQSTKSADPGSDIFDLAVVPAVAAVAASTVLVAAADRVTRRTSTQVAIAVTVSTGTNRTDSPTARVAVANAPCCAHQFVVFSTAQLSRYEAA